MLCKDERIKALARKHLLKMARNPGEFLMLLLSEGVRGLLVEVAKAQWSNLLLLLVEFDCFELLAREGQL